MPTLLFFPIVPFILEAALVVYWLIVAGYLWSAGDLYEVRITTSADLPQDSGTGLTIFDGSDSSSSSSSNFASWVTPEEAADWPCEKNPYCRFDLEWNENIRYMFLYHLFGLLWTN